MNNWQNPDNGGFGGNNFGSGLMSGLGQLFGGMFGNSGKPYDDAEKAYREWAAKAAGAQQPYQNAGVGALGDYQDWLKGQKDPAKFINDQMGKYNESEYAHNLKQQSMNAGQNAASASGLMGSTPMMQQLQQNAGAITSADQDKWLQNVLGINTQYGQGQNNLVNTGQNSANSLSNIYGHMGDQMGQTAYGKQAGKNQDWSNMFGGIGSLLGMFL
jgi:hypothetical protein